MSNSCPLATTSSCFKQIMATPDFHFKRCSIQQQGAAHPVGTDAILLGAWTNIGNALRILDIGTGTGVVALMLAQRTENHEHVQIDAVEIHQGSAACAARNFAASPWNKRLHVVELSIQEFAQQTDLQYDLIVSNPPYFSETTKAPDPTRRLGRHIESLPPQDMLRAVRKLLAPNGRFSVILPVKEGWKWCELAVPLGLCWTRITEVYGRKEKPVERLIIEFQRNPYLFQRDSLVVYDQGQEYSEAYGALTREFYLRG